MTKGVAVELDSYRLAQYVVQVPCYICGEGNTFDAELCRHCFAPMALAHQSRSQGIHPQMVATIGSSGVGKTVYLGMLLDMLSRQPERLQALARGAFSITLQQTTIAAMSRCTFPTKTPTEPDRWNWVHCQVRSPEHRRAVELIMPDIAGEALFEEVDHPHTYRVINSLLTKCAGVLILIDAFALQDGMLDQDYFTMKLLTYLSELAEDNGSSWKHRPVALIFSKSDQCENCFEDPSSYAQRHTPGLWQHCQQRFKNFKFFASGVAGACAVKNVPGEGHRRVPLRIEPRGIIEPFEWLVQQMKV
jgi:hypothetical protein